MNEQKIQALAEKVAREMREALDHPEHFLERAHFEEGPLVGWYLRKSDGVPFIDHGNFGRPSESDGVNTGFIIGWIDGHVLEGDYLREASAFFDREITPDDDNEDTRAVMRQMRLKRRVDENVWFETSYYGDFEEPLSTRLEDLKLSAADAIRAFVDRGVI